ncbi:hypothetical protein L6R52_38195 [Myxococcota bacterium]|nr:hypothetical protein [Myxococcota bacterium]
MIAKVSMLNRVLTARKRLRDAASAASAQAEALRLDAEHREHAVEAGIGRLLAGAGARFAAAEDPANELLSFQLDREHAHTALAIAAEHTAKQRAEADKKRAELAAKARELKTSERALDRTLDAIEAVEKRQEQFLADDLTGARRWRSRG